MLLTTEDLPNEMTRRSQNILGIIKVENNHSSKSSKIEPLDRLAPTKLAQLDSPLSDENPEPQESASPI